MKGQQWLNAIVTESMGREGPTGRMVVVLEAELRDYGGNVYAKARTLRGLERARIPRGVATRWVAVKTGRAVREDEYVEPAQII